MMIENLENRRLLAANLVNGVLNVTGGNGNDVINVSKSGSTLTVKIGSARQTFNVGAVKTMVVKGLGGNDNISFGYGTCGATIDAGDGDDRVVGTSSADNIFAGRGNDYVHAWLGNDQVNGGDGNDTLIGCVGNDVVRGGWGNDLISGAVGDDQIYGEGGNDTIFGAAGNDRVDGGDGYDSAGREGYDSFAKVEKIW